MIIYIYNVFPVFALDYFLIYHCQQTGASVRSGYEGECLFNAKKEGMLRGLCKMYIMKETYVWILVFIPKYTYF